MNSKQNNVSSLSRFSSNDNDVTFVEGLKIVWRSIKTGKLCKTQRGPRSWHVAWKLSDGSLLVGRKNHEGGFHHVATRLPKLHRLLSEGIVKKELRSWDPDELDMYIREV